jgi:hypothetical protein
MDAWLWWLLGGWAAATLGIGYWLGSLSRRGPIRAEPDIADRLRTARSSRRASATNAVNSQGSSEVPVSPPTREDERGPA